MPMMHTSLIYLKHYMQIKKQSSFFCSVPVVTACHSMFSYHIQVGVQLFFFFSLALSFKLLYSHLDIYRFCVYLSLLLMRNSFIYPLFKIQTNTHIKKQWSFFHSHGPTSILQNKNQKQKQNKNKNKQNKQTKKTCSFFMQFLMYQDFVLFMHNSLLYFTYTQVKAVLFHF